MSVWRPPQEIRVKCVAIARRGDSFLFVEVLADDQRVKGLRPIGGSVEFGETRETALLRELKEELDVGATIVGDWAAFENIYDHEGSLGHEIIFSAPVRFHEEPGGGAPRFTCKETGGPATACWASLGDAGRKGLDIFPPTLVDYLRALR